MSGALREAGVRERTSHMRRQSSTDYIGGSVRAAARDKVGQTRTQLLVSRTTGIVAAVIGGSTASALRRAVLGAGLTAPTAWATKGKAGAVAPRDQLSPKGMSRCRARDARGMTRAEAAVASSAPSSRCRRSSCLTTFRSRGVPDGRCETDHRGYVFKGSFRITYTDGPEGVFRRRPGKPPAAAAFRPDSRAGRGDGDQPCRAARPHDRDHRQQYWSGGVMIHT